jgi:hypothetical protein
MPRSPAPFRQSDVTRAVKGLQDAGLRVGRVEIEPGKITVWPANASPTPVKSPLDEWEEKRGARQA